MNYDKFVRLAGFILLALLLASCTISAKDGVIIIDPNHPDSGPYYPKIDRCIGDRIWNDINGNGLQESNEGSISGVTLTLYKEVGTIDGISNNSDITIASQTTDVNGAYNFCGLEAAPTFYVVTITDTAGVLANSTFTTSYTAANPTPVSISLTADGAESSRSDVDFGYQLGVAPDPTPDPTPDPKPDPDPVHPDPNPSGDTCIGNRIWADSNENGLQDAGEVGVNGVTIQLYKEVGINDGVVNDGDLLVAMTMTSGDGNYRFCSLETAPVYYVIRISDNDGVLLGASQTSQTLVSIGLNPDEVKDDIDFGFKGVK